MFNTLSRPYKDLDPSITIEKIKEILHGINLYPEESFSGNPYPELYSMRIQLSREYGEFGTNGKGRTSEYSVASGYAEFVERIQNNIFGTLSRTLMSEIKEKFGFYYSPDEKYLDPEEILKLPKNVIDDNIIYSEKCAEDFLNEYYQRARENKVEGIVSLPFYNVREDKLTYLPWNLLMITVGSNGMAAGNTREEAIFQGLCELMERWGAAEVFYNQITPPDIPREYIQKFHGEYEIIKNIERSGKYKVVVKDFSVGKNIPSMGVIIINEEDKTYKLNVGADTSFQVALSRCLTEMYQGIDNEEKFDKIMQPIPTELPIYFKDDNRSLRVAKYNEFSKFTVDGSGAYPMSLFGEIPHYDFNPEVFITKKDYKEENIAMMENLMKEGYDVYIRDNSFLGFPSVMVYIPEISALGRKNNYINNRTGQYNSIELDKIEELFLQLHTASESQLEEFEEIVSKMPFNISIEKLFNIEIKKGSNKGNIDINFFLTLLRHKLGKKEEALESLRKFMKNNDIDKEYYSVAEAYFEEYLTVDNEQLITEKLIEKGHESNKVKEVVGDLKDPDKIFKYIETPKCPDCQSCKVSDICNSRGYKKLTEIIYTKMKSGFIDQRTIRDSVS